MIRIRVEINDSQSVVRVKYINLYVFHSYYSYI